MFAYCTVLNSSIRICALMTICDIEHLDIGQYLNIELEQKDTFVEHTFFRSEAKVKMF